MPTEAELEAKIAKLEDKCRLLEEKCSRLHVVALVRGCPGCANVSSQHYSI
jgi:hypothetical protein